MEEPDMGFIIVGAISFGVGFAVKYFIGNYLGVPIIDYLVGFIAGGFTFLLGAPILLFSEFFDDK